MAKFIRFSKCADTRHDKPCYRIVNIRSGDPLGLIEWYPPWRKWIAAFEEHVVWSYDCLKDVIDFMKSLGE